MTLNRLITKLRGFTEAELTDEFGGWSDEALEDILLQHGEFHKKLPLMQTHNPLVYSYSLPVGSDIEAGVSVVDNYGDVIPNVIIDFKRRLVTLEEEPYGTVDLIASVYNLYEAAADVWAVKVNQRVDYVEFRAGSHRINAKQEYDHCVQRMNYYAGKTVRGFKR